MQTQVVLKKRVCYNFVRFVKCLPENHEWRTINIFETKSSFKDLWIFWSEVKKEQISSIYKTALKITHAWIVVNNNLWPEIASFVLKIIENCIILEQNLLLNKTFET